MMSRSVSESSESEIQAMNALRRLIPALELSPLPSGEQERIVWERWAKLKDLHE